MKKNLLIIGLFLIDIAPSLLKAQEIWQSDMSVQMKQDKSGGYQFYTIEVKTENDDASRAPHLIFTLPRNSKVRGVNFDGRLSDTAYTICGNHSQATKDKGTRADGYVKVDFPNLNKLTTTLTISIEPTKKGWQKDDGASAYIFSNTPELNKENNFIYLPLNR